MKRKVNITQVIEQTRTANEKKITTIKLGTLIELSLKQDLIYVDYEENPLRTPLIAELANPNLTLEDLEHSQNTIKYLQLEFLNGDPAKPLIKDVLYSAASLKQPQKHPLENQSIHIKADEIIFEGNTKIVFKSGKVETSLIAEGNRIVEKADTIDRSATYTHKLKGGSISLN